ncbi:MAG: PrgI family protein [Patescibacteria group bacterium]
MRFQVPQFLEIEDKIFGPFTFKEFVYLAGGAGLCFVLYKLLGLTIGILPILAVAGISLLLTFYRPNDKPFINMVEAGLTYFMQSKLYIWKRREGKIDDGRKKAEALEVERKRKQIEGGAKLGANKLRDLAWSLDVLDLNKHPEN